MLICDIRTGRMLEVSEQELYHWKYIKREKKNGRWVYYYDQSDLDRYKNKADRAKKFAEQEQLKYAGARANVAINADIYKTNPNKYAAESIINNAIDAQKYEKGMKVAASNAKKAEKAYQKRAIKSFAARTISKGAVKVANVLSKLFSKKK